MVLWATLLEDKFCLPQERDLAWSQVCPQQEGCPQATGKVHLNCSLGACTFYSAWPAPLRCRKALGSRGTESTSFGGFQSEEGWMASLGVSRWQATPSGSCSDSDPHSTPCTRQAGESCCGSQLSWPSARHLGSAIGCSRVLSLLRGHQTPS